MEFLKGIFGEELYGQVEEKVTTYNSTDGNKDKQIKLVNVNDGSYVSKEKYLTLKTKADGLDEQLRAAGGEIQSYKEMDIDGIKQKASEWEEKYKTDTAVLEEKISAQAYDFEAERFVSKYKFSSDLAKKAALQEFREKKFQLENGNFLGADDFMKQMKESNPNAFVEEEQQNAGKYQTAVRRTSGSYKPPQVGDEKAYMDQKYSNNPYYKQ